MDAKAARAGPHLEIRSGFRNFRRWWKAVVLGLGIVTPTVTFAGGILSALSGDDRAWAAFVLGTMWLGIGFSLVSKTTVAIGGAAVESRTLWRSIRIPFSDVRGVSALRGKYGPLVTVKSRRGSSIWLDDEFSVADRERFLEQLWGQLKPFGVRIEPMGSSVADQERRLEQLRAELERSGVRIKPMGMEYPRIPLARGQTDSTVDWRTGEGPEDAALPPAAEPEARREQRLRPAYLILVVGGTTALLALFVFVLARVIELGSFGLVVSIGIVAASLVVGEIYLLLEHDRWGTVAQGLILCAVIFTGAYPLVAIAADIRDPLADPTAWPAFVAILAAGVFLIGLEILGSRFRHN